MPVINCDCEATSPYRTLAEVRTDIAVELGYAAMAANLPPGESTLIDTVIRSSQKLLYRKHAEFRTERFFRWMMEIGERFYGFDANDTDTDIDCNKVLDPNTVTWVGFEDLNGTFQPLTHGIKPEWYTRLASSNGFPSHYEFRSCIEIFPAPDAAYFLWVKGRFGLGTLTTNDHRLTLDDEGVRLLALGRLKKMKGKPDADSILTQASTYEQAMVAAAHGTRRYIPGAKAVRPMTPPRLTTFISGDG